MKYVIESRPGRWILTQEGEILSSHADRMEALQHGALMAMANKAAGDRVSLWLKDVSGQVLPVDLEHPAAAVADHRPGAAAD